MAKKTQMGRIIIDSEHCKGCYLCMSVCPNQVIMISRSLNQQGYYPVEPVDKVNDGKGCTGCAMCATICPDIAIEVYRE